MKVILINPKTAVKYNLGFKLFNSVCLPLGLAYIASVLEKEKIEVIVEDQNANNKTEKQLIERVMREKPQLVGFSCLGNTLDTIRKISSGIRKNSQATIVAGNINAAVFAEEFLQEGITDIAVRGEGEYVMLDICRAIENQSSLKEIKGISYREGETIIHNEARASLANLDELPYPGHHLFNLDDYKSQVFFLRCGRYLPVSVSRGCNYNCVFCSNKTTHDKFRFREPEGIVDEIAFLHNRFGVKTIGLMGSYFPINRSHTERFCDLMMEKGLHKKIRWLTESRVDKVDNGLLKKMKESGLYFIMYGCDFGTQKMLDRVDKRTTCQQAEEAVRAAKEAGIVTVCYFLLGGPGETKQDCDQTIRFAIKLDCNIAKFNITVPYPGSPLFEIFRRRHSVSYDKLDNIVSWTDWSANQSNLLCDEAFSSRELIYLQRKAMFKFYFRPKIITRLGMLIRHGFSLRYAISAGYVLSIILFKIAWSVYQNSASKIFRKRKRLKC